MRVIAGIAKGRRLAAPKSNTHALSLSKGIRPVLDQVKEAIFNILFDVTGLRVLDLFAGTGAMGIETLSRGAVYCCFVDKAKEAVRLIGKNIDLCQMAERSYVLPMTIGKALALLETQQKKFNLVFVDPPYEKYLVNKTLLRLALSPALNSEAIVVVEHHPNESIGTIEGLNLTSERKYGQTRVSFLRKL